MTTITQVNPLWVLEQPDSTGNEIIAACAAVAELVSQCNRLTAMVRGRAYTMPIRTAETLTIECDAMDAALAPFTTEES